MNGSEKVLHVFGKLDYGGAELRTLGVSRHLIADGYRIDYCCLSGEKGGLSNLFEEQGSKVFPIKLNILFAYNFIRLIKTEKYTIVHSHVAHSSGFILAIAYIAGIKKRISHYRSTGSGFKSRRPIRRIVENIKKSMVNIFSTKITAVSEGTMREAWSENWIKDPRCSIIYNGLDHILDSSLYSRDYIIKSFDMHQSLKIVLHVGNMSEPKNHLRLIEIFKAIKDSAEENYKLLMVGRKDEPIHSLVKKKIIDLGLTDDIYLLGRRSDVLQLMYAADGLLHPSLWEGLPGSVLEAAQMDLPTVAADLSGVQEISKYFSSINSLSLQKTNQEWADEFIKTIRLYSRRPAESLDLMVEDTPFSMKSCVAGFRNLWS